MSSVLTPLQLTATAGLLQNQGLSDNKLANAVTVYTSTNLIAPFANTIAVGSTGNILSNTVITQLTTLAANNCPALSDSIPAANAGSYPTELLTTLLTNTANQYLGNGDLTKFIQAESVAQGYGAITNQFINSAVNSQTYLDNTFTNMNNMITGDITAVNPCTEVWGSDLKNLGGLINLKALDDLGTPVALIKQLASFGGITPQITLAFKSAGVPDEVVINLNSPSLDASDVDQKAMYLAMTKITGDDLAQVLSILNVTTANINTMADLLNPYKIFPNSFQTLAVINTSKVSQNIYLNDSGTINPTLAQGLPAIAVNTLI